MRTELEVMEIGAVRPRYSEQVVDLELENSELRIKLCWTRFGLGVVAVGFLEAVWMLIQVWG